MLTPVRNVMRGMSLRMGSVFPAVLRVNIGMGLVVQIVRQDVLHAPVQAIVLRVKQDILKTAAILVLHAELQIVQHVLPLVTVQHVKKDITDIQLQAADYAVPEAV